MPSILGIMMSGEDDISILVEYEQRIVDDFGDMGVKVDIKSLLARPEFRHSLLSMAKTQVDEKLSFNPQHLLYKTLDEGSYEEIEYVFGQFGSSDDFIEDLVENDHFRHSVMVDLLENSV